MNKVSIFKYFLITILATVVSYLFGRLFVESISKLTLTDFHVYYYVPKMVITNNAPMFPYINFSPIYPYFFPPASIPVLFLLSLMPFYMAKIFWTILNFILLLGSVYFILKSLNIVNKLNLILGLLLSFIFYPIIFTIRDGQFNIVMLFIFSFSLYEFTSNRFKNYVSIPLALGIVSKISPGILFIYLFLKKKYKLIFLTSMFVGFFMLLAEIFVQPKINYLYFKNVVSQVSAQSNGMGWSDQSLLALIKKINSDYNLKLNSVTQSLINYSFVLILLSIYFYLERKTTKIKSKLNEHLNLALLTFISVTGTGLTWFHQYSILFMPWLLLFLISILYVKKYRIYFIFSYLIIFCSWAFDLRDIPLPVPYLNLNMFWAGLWFLGNTFVLKANPQFMTQEKLLNLDFEFEDYKRTFFIACLSGFLIGLNIWNLNETLKESRDFTRINDITYMGKKLVKNDMKYEIGSSDSFIKNNRLDRGYILLQKDEFKKLIHAMPVLYFDPINDAKFNYKFKSNDGINFEISSKLESKKYIDEYGSEFTFKFNAELKNK